MVLSDVKSLLYRGNKNLFGRGSATMTEDMFLKLLGWVGVLGLVYMGARGIWKRYREMNLRVVVYRFDESDHEEEKTRSRSTGATE